MSPPQSASGNSSKGRMSAFNGSMNGIMNKSSHIAYELSNCKAYLVLSIKFRVSIQLEPNLFLDEIVQ